MDPYAVVSKNVRFWSHLVVLVPSILCSFFVLYHFLVDRNLRRALNNHVFVVIIIIGLIAELTVYPWKLYNLRQSEIWIRPPTFCLIWEFIERNFYPIQTFLIAWATIERHILIFNDRLMKAKRWRLALHYFPIIAVLLYGFIVYSYTFFFPPCANLYYNTYNRCMYPCLWLQPNFAIYELYAHAIAPPMIMMVFSLLLLIRVIRMKIRMRQPNHWRRNLKMAIQLLVNVLVNMLFILPYAIIVLIPYIVRETPAVIGGVPLFTYLVYVFGYIYAHGIMFTPFVCLFTSNELRSRFLNSLRLKTAHPNTVTPMILGTDNQQLRTTT